MSQPNYNIICCSYSGEIADNRPNKMRPSFAGLKRNRRRGPWVCYSLESDRKANKLSFEELKVRLVRRCALNAEVRSVCCVMAAKRGAAPL